MDEQSTLNLLVSVSSLTKDFVIPTLALLFGYMFLVRLRGRSPVRLGTLLGLLAGRGRLRGIRSVVDGDSLEVIKPNGALERVRLIGIDAPEYRTQPYGRESRAALAALLQPRDRSGRLQTITIQRFGRDRYGRTLARVWCGSICVNSWMVANGHAWANGGLSGRLSMTQARLSRRGLWAAGTPVPPSQWRRVSA